MEESQRKYGFKVPVPTDINLDDRFTFLDRAIFREIICKCQRKDAILNFIHAGRFYSVEMKRGSALLKIREISKNLNIDHRRVRKSVTTLSKWYTVMYTKPMPFGLIITVKDYDNITGMSHNLYSSGKVAVKKRESSGKVDVALKKSVESVESEEIVKNVEPRLDIKGFESVDLEAYKGVPYNDRPMKVRFVGFIKKFNELTGRHYKFLPRYFQTFKTRLATYSSEEISRAVANAASDKFLRGENKEGRDWLTVEYILRESSLEKWLNID